MSRRRRDPWVWVRLTVGAAILAVLFWQLGLDPFLEPLHRIDAAALAAAAGIAVLTTACCAWRWRLVSRGLGSDLPMGTAISACYRSQFLNTVLPGGVLGDVHRAVRRGRDVGDVGHGLRVVAWERSAGQVVQVALTALALLVLPSPVRSSMPTLLVAGVTAALAVVLLGRALSRRGHPALVRVVRAVADDIRRGLLARRAWPGVVLTSAVVVLGHTATFLIAARTAGSTTSAVEMLPLALLVLLATALPTNIAGWGPREGAAAWVFAMAGLGAAQGVATAVVYGVLVLVATLPGAALLMVAWLRPGRGQTEPAAGDRLRLLSRRRPRAGVPLEGATHG
ncbi:MAG TPA: lysylphosphatidylglycerol synthase transmembrane domain-containing protein [Nocardioidaceae bacterium]|nr:lysylphosphatidylglycerol synthase transmembrane domain-containing protein [Nocardioidaceae bacterium]